MRTATSIVLALICALSAVAAVAQEANPEVRRQPPGADQADTQRLIVKFRSGSTTGRAQALAAGDPVTALASRSGVTVQRARRLTGNLQVLDTDPLAAGETLAERLDRVRADPSVEYAEPDRRRYAHALPNDPLYTGQWYLQQQRGEAVAAIDAEHAWDTTEGNTGVVIAVLDTGVLYDHPDLGRMAAGGKLLPGYDFIANATFSNDGDGRDPDPADPGDFVTQAEANRGSFSGCGASGSSWHGTRVSGIIGARTDNSEGIAGIARVPWILPVRVLGKCGGSDSDILAAMLWAAGIHVDGVPDNPFAAKIENLSLGAVGNCGATSPYRDVIAAVNARGTLVVVSAGNEGGPVDNPANCPGAAAVGGLRHAGTKVGYSSLGTQVALSAPAGNCVNIAAGAPCLFSIDTTYSTSSTTPGAFGYTNQLDANYGTSFSAPIVAGIAGLMASVNSNLGAPQLIERLKEGAVKPFPVSTDPTIPQCHVPTGQNDIQNTECSCTTSTCGAGMANAPGAVAAALRPIATISAPATVGAGQNVTLSAASSAAANGRTVNSYEWALVCGVGGVTSMNGPETTVVAPATGSITVRLVVTDDMGRQDTAGIAVSSSSTTPNAGNVCPVTVTVTPTNTSLQTGLTQTFSAVVGNAQDTTVVWQAGGVTGGNATVGTISAAGVYSAPASVPTPASVTITAISNQDSARSGSVSVTIVAPAPPPVTPSSGGGGGGGGAAVELLPLLLLSLAAARRRRVRA